MKNTRSQVQQFLNDYAQNERYSSYGGDNYGNFTPDDLTSSADAGGAAALPVSKPYVLRIENTNVGATVNAILFGFNTFYGQTNYGNNVAIAITSTTAANYGQLLTQSQNKPFDIAKWRFSCSNTAQLDQTMTISYVDANGRTCSDPVTLTNYKDPYQQVNTLLDVNYPVKVDGNTYLTIPMLASAILYLSMFPQGIADQANTLVGGGGNKGFRIPKLAGLNAPIVNVSGAAVIQPNSNGRTMGQS